MDSFGFAKLVVGDLEKTASFYKAVFGLTEQARVDSAIDGRVIREILFKPTAPGGATLVLLTFPDMPDPVSSEVILGFTTADMSALLERTRIAGGTIVEEAARRPEHGVTVAFVRDVEGHLIEIVQPL